MINIKQDNIHYNIDKLASKNALFNLLLGEKSGGKSYQVKHKMAVEHFLKTGKRFILRIKLSFTFAGGGFFSC